jgi:hypothetical protein
LPGKGCQQWVLFCFCMQVLAGLKWPTKKQRVNTALSGSLTAADVGTGSLDFLAVCEVSLEMCPLSLFASWNSSWAVDSAEVPFTTPLYPAMHSPSGQPSVHSVLPCTCSGFPCRGLQKYALISSSVLIIGSAGSLSPFQHPARLPVRVRESESLYNWRSVSQYVLVSSPIWGFWSPCHWVPYILAAFQRPSMWSSVRAPDYRTEMYCVSCEVRTEFIYVV